MLRNSTNLVSPRAIDSTIDISNDDSSSDGSSVISRSSNESFSDVSEASYHFNLDEHVANKSRKFTKCTKDFYLHT